nr:MAG TPA: hypothetical protein [Caudoviricetes sp.]DAW60056.1 MAG TPA: hypothetical protein [Caudoviricetes sp.]
MERIRNIPLIKKIKTLYKLITDTAEQAGIKVLSDARCCQCGG